MKKYDVIALGEALIDYIPTEENVCGMYKSSIGGAPLNVAMGVAKLRGTVALIGRVGHDALGNEIIRALQNESVDCSMIQVDNERHTPVTIVLPDSSDMTRYIIYRENCADGALERGEIPEEIFSETYILHTGVLLCTSAASSKTVKTILAQAKAQGALISLDVNMRPGCWKSDEGMITASTELAEIADIIKLTHEEAQTMDLPIDKYSKEGKLLLITNGSKDVCIYWKNQSFKIPVKQVKVVDVTGAGDAFVSAFLFQYVSFLKSGVQIGFSEIGRCADVAIRAGSHAVQVRGAYYGYPAYEDLYEN